jgi:dephospho-CoA kinase
MSTEERRTDTADGLFIVGLVGRTGSGKSTVARAFAERGAVVIEGDALGHEVTDWDPDVRRALVAEYGENAYRPDGTLDRARIAARVFTDADARARLDRLVHPRIIEAIREELDRLRGAGHQGVVVIDAALLLEWGLERWCDLVIAVTASERQQILRLARSRRWSEEESRRRLSAQRTNEAFTSAADLTLANDSDNPTRLDEQAREIWTELQTIRAARHRMTGKEPC